MTGSQIALKDVISNDVVYANPQDTLREALAAMVENRVSALPVVDARRHCVGVISVTDLLGVAKDLSDELSALSEAGGLDHEALVAKLEHADLLTEPVQAWMSPDPIAVGIASTIQQAARLMLQNRVHRLVVLDDQKHLVGVVSTMDLLAAFSEVGNG
ncbi:MAG: HPP family protein [Pirellulales bacterium]